MRIKDHLQYNKKIENIKSIYYNDSDTKCSKPILAFEMEDNNVFFSHSYGDCFAVYDEAAATLYICPSMTELGNLYSVERWIRVNYDEYLSKLEKHEYNPSRYAKPFQNLLESELDYTAVKLMKNK